MILRTMRTMSALTLCCFWAGSALAQGQAAPSCSAGATAQPAVKLGPLTVERCFVPYDAEEKAAFKDITSYYGSVEMDVASGTELQLDKSVGTALAKFFGVEDEFTAIITVGVYSTLAGEEVLVYEKPIYSIKRDGSGKTKLSASIVGGFGIAIAPTFALDSTNMQVRTRLKVALVNSRKFNPMPIVKEGINLAAKMGGPASLVTAAGEPALLAVASRIQSTYEAVLSDEETGDLDTFLKFDRTNGIKKVVYKVRIAMPKSQVATSDVTIGLVSSETRITSVQPPLAGGRAKWPNVSDVKGKRFSAQIKLVTRTDAGLAQTDLATVLDQQGVPQKLEELSIASAASEQLTRQDAVNKSCRALYTALQKGPYRLSDADMQLVLFDELKTGGVFDRYDAAQLSCTHDLVPVWKARYNLVPNVPAKSRDIPWKAKEARLLRMARSWDMLTPEVRTFALGEDFVSGNIKAVAPLGFIPGVPSDVGMDGRQEFVVAVSYLAMRKKICFGSFKPNTDQEPWATAFVRFEGDPALYLATLRFDTRADFLLDPGPRVEAVDMRVATAGDKAVYDQTGKCS